MNPTLNLWLIPILPLAGFVINGLFGKKSSRQTVSVVALFFSGAAFAFALWVALRFSSLSLPYQDPVSFHWIRITGFTADFAFYLDQLSLVMLLVVTGVGFLIHIYSVGYMWDDPSYYRFFAYLNLFMFFMLTLVLANNYLLMFIGWEGVGLASYLLIGFWFTERFGGISRQKSIHRQPHRRLRIPDRTLPSDQAFRFAELRAGVRCSQTAVGGNCGRWPAHDDRHSAHGGSSRKVGADSPLRLAARCHGRPHTSFGAHPCCHDGDSRRLHGLALAHDF